MKLSEIAPLRLRNQRLSGAKFKSAEEVVGWLGAVQAQEYPVAKWSIGQRTGHLTDSAVDDLLAEGTILRTHILRPTWHFVLPADIRWMMALTAPRIAAKLRPSAGLPIPEESLIRAGLDAIGEWLAGGRRMMRREMSAMLIERGFAATTPETTAILIRAELDLVIASGGLDGKVQTYASVGERAPALDHFDRDWALAELTHRYFTGHGPATIPDFTWWSSLTVADTKRGLEINEVNGQALERIEVDGTSYWWAGGDGDPTSPVGDDPSPTVHLIQAYDEYLVGYGPPRDRINIAKLASPSVLHSPPFLHAVILDSQVVGFWRRVTEKEGFVIETRPLRALSPSEQKALARAAERYAAFVEKPVKLA